MNKRGLIFIILIISVIGIFTLAGNANKNAKITTMPTVSQNENIPETIVTVANTGFNPQAVKIKVGTKVVWMNKSGSMVTVNSASHPAHTAYPSLNLGQFPNGSSVSLVFDKPGTYKYHNHLNPTQFGSVTVE